MITPKQLQQINYEWLETIDTPVFNPLIKQIEGLLISTAKEGRQEVTIEFTKSEAYLRHAVKMYFTHLGFRCRAEYYQTKTDTRHCINISW